MFMRARMECGALLAVALAATFLVSLSADQFCITVAESGEKSEGVAEIRPPSSPAAAYRAFRQAQAALDWSSEFLCHTPREQARFSHIVIVTALYLEFQSDLYLQVESALERHGLSDADFEGFWPKSVYEIVDEATADNSVDDFQAEYEARVDRWQQDVVPKIRDCAGLIATLQPLIREGARRLSSGSTVAMTVRRLDGYAYGRLRDIKFDGTRATGTIKVKSRFAAFVVSDKLRKAAGDLPEEASTSPSSENANVVLDGYGGLYAWLWESGAEIYSLARSMRHSHMVIIGLPTGDLVVGPDEVTLERLLEPENSSDHRDADDSVVERVDNRDETEEVGLANNGTRTVTEMQVTFQLIAGMWYIDAIECR